MRLIDADALFVRLAEYHAHSYGKVERAYGEAIEVVQNAPTIDAVPVVHARWVYDRPYHYMCSVCSRMWGITAMTMAYCPDCGAKMDGGAEE